MKTVLILILLSVAIWAGWKWFKNQPMFVIRHIELIQPLAEQNTRELLEVTQAAIDGNFFSMNIDTLREAIEKLAWIESVSLRKIWSDTIKMKITEKQVAARWVSLSSSYKKSDLSDKWDQGSLISSQGAIFKPVLNVLQISHFDQYAIYAGPDNLSATIQSRCDQIKQIMSNIGSSVNVCKMDRRRSWTLIVDDGIRLNLGNNDISSLHLGKIERLLMDRIKRFAYFYEKNLKVYRDKIKQIDMRYTNGFTVQWKT